MGEQARDLCFESAGAHDLAERGVGGEWQQIAGDIEGAGLEGALVGLGLEGFGARDAAAKQLEDGGGGALVGIEELLYGLGIELRGPASSWPKSGKYQPDLRKFW